MLLLSVADLGTNAPKRTEVLLRTTALPQKHQLLTSSLMSVPYLTVQPIGTCVTLALALMARH
jgi:hypothetical protein